MWSIACTFVKTTQSAVIKTLWKSVTERSFHPEREQCGAQTVMLGHSRFTDRTASKWRNDMCLSSDQRRPELRFHWETLKSSSFLKSSLAEIEGAKRKLGRPRQGRQWPLPFERRLLYRIVPQTVPE